jgi:S-adenosylmethionine:tRNA ribosyltransferase-isomerase
MPVRVEDYTRHRMLPEYFELSTAAAARLNAAKARGKRIVAVGTTSVRVLEYCATPAGFQAQQGWCDLYIYPGYRFQAVDRMLTNFHLPKSTLLLLVSAFAGRDQILQAYAEAVQERYRFYSYGDCMLHFVVTMSQIAGFLSLCELLARFNECATYQKGAGLLLGKWLAH